jgi:hypothetical protein
MEQSPNKYSTSEETPGFLRNPKVQYNGQKIATRPHNNPE